MIRTVPHSIALHLAVLGLLALVGGRVQPQAWRSPELIRVRFAGPGGPGAGKARLVAPAVKAASETPAPPKPEPGTRHVPKAPPAKDKKAKPPAPTAKGYAPDQKSAKPTDTAGGIGGKPGGQGVPGGSRGGGATAGGTDQPFPFDWYLSLVQERISRNWDPAAVGFVAPSSRECTVHFVIGGDGRIADVTIAQSSGEALFDREALRAVTATNPLPGLPAGFGSRALGVSFIFTLRPEL